MLIYTSSSASQQVDRARHVCLMRAARVDAPLPQTIADVPAELAKEIEAHNSSYAAHKTGKHFVALVSASCVYVVVVVVEHDRLRDIYCLQVRYLGAR